MDERHDETRPYDVAVVLGAALRADGTAGPALRRRVDLACRLFEAGRVRHLLMTGGAVGHPKPEALVMRDLAVAAGVPATRIAVEDQARRTRENARFSVSILEAREWRRVLVVTDGFHLPRALFMFRRHGLAVTGAGVRSRGGDAWSVWLAQWLREAAAWVKVIDLLFRPAAPGRRRPADRG